MFVGQTSGHFSRPKGRIIVRHYRYFFTISQQKPGKRNFCEKYFFYEQPEFSKELNELNNEW